jgi:prepilin peptidase CpaA
VIWERIGEVVLAGVLIAAAVFDLRGGNVYNWLTYPAILVGLAFGAAAGAATGDLKGGVQDHLLGFGFGFGVLLVAFLLGGTHGGDVKLMGAVGAFLGWPGVLHAIFYSFLVGVVVGLIMMVWQGQTLAVLKRLAVAIRLLPIPSMKMDEAVPVDTLQVPFAFAVCVGTLWWMIEHVAQVSLGDLVCRLAHA